MLIYLYVAEDFFLNIILKGTPPRSGRVMLKNKKIENLFFLVTNIFCVLNLLWYLNISSIGLATRFEFRMHLLINRYTCNTKFK